MISVSEASNSKVELAVRVRVRLVSRSNLAEMAVRAVVSRSSKSTKRGSMVSRDLTVSRVINMGLEGLGGRDFQQEVTETTERTALILDFRFWIAAAKEV